MLHFLRFNTPNHAGVIRKVSLVCHVETQRPNLDIVDIQIGRTSLVYAFDLLARLPNLQEFKERLELRINCQVIMKCFTPWLRPDPEAQNSYPTAWEEEHSKSNGEDAKWTFRSFTQEEISRGYSVEGPYRFLEARGRIIREYMSSAPLHRNKVAQIYDNHLTQIYANNDEETDDEMVRELKFCLRGLRELKGCLHMYHKWQRQSQDLVSDHGRAKRYLDGV